MLPNRQVLLVIVLSPFLCFVQCANVQPYLEDETRKRRRYEEDDCELSLSMGSAKRLCRTHAGRRVLGLTRKQRQYHSIYRVKPREESSWFSWILGGRMEAADFFKTFRCASQLFVR